DHLNWQGDVLPANGDEVVIPDVAATTLVRLSSGNWHISKLTSDEAFAFSGGTLAVDSTVQVNNTFTLNGGTLQNATVQPGSGGQGLSVSGTLSNVTLNAGLEVPVGASLQVDGGLTLNSTAQVDGSGNSSFAGRLDFLSSQTLGGTGTVVLNFNPGAQVTS